MVVFDASILVLLFDPDARPPTDPDTGQPVSRCKERLDYLIATFEREQTKVIIPTPVLSEALVRPAQPGTAARSGRSGATLSYHQAPVRPAPRPADWTLALAKGEDRRG